MIYPIPFIISSIGDCVRFCYE